MTSQWREVKRLLNESQRNEDHGMLVQAVTVLTGITRAIEDSVVGGRRTGMFCNQEARWVIECCDEGRYLSCAKHLSAMVEISEHVEIGGQQVWKIVRTIGDSQPCSYID